MSKRLSLRETEKALGVFFLVAGFSVISFFFIWQLTTASSLGHILRGWLGTLSPNSLAYLMDRDMVSVSSGPFTMGSASGRTDELPVHEVILAGYAIDRFEVTNAQYARFVKATNRTPPRYWLNGEYPSGLADYPVVGVSWQEAADYCNWVNKRLPSEAEWEKVCRGNDSRNYPWGNQWLPEAANVKETCRIPSSQYIDALWPLLKTSPLQGQIGIRPVGSFPDSVSQFGVMDLAGNATEWVEDWYNATAYAELPTENPLGAQPQWNHVLRGSSWWVNPGSDDLGSGETAAFESRCTARNASHSYDDPRTGFRCAR